MLRFNNHCRGYEFNLRGRYTETRTVTLRQSMRLNHLSRRACTRCTLLMATPITAKRAVIIFKKIAFTKSTALSIISEARLTCRR